MQDSIIDNHRPKLLVLGATGGTGRLIVRDAVARGFDVTVLVRSAEKAQDLTGAKLVIGDARDEAVLRQALHGRDAVVSALGTPASPFPRSALAVVRDPRAGQRDEARARLAPGLHHRDGRR